MRDYKSQFAEAWDKTSQVTFTGRPMDALICPAAPSAGTPHDFNAYWGYTSMFNFLDYPSTILPVAKFNIDPHLDAVNRDYQPVMSNPYDKAYHEMCKIAFHPAWHLTYLICLYLQITQISFPINHPLYRLLDALLMTKN